MFTIRHPRALLRQHDLHVILIVVLIDLSLTIEGISTGQGSEANPFYVPFTESVEMMVVGVGLYVAILAGLSLVLTGATRKILASLAFGMHVVGAMTWSFIVVPSFYEHLNIFWYMLAGTAATALFYFSEDIADFHRRGKKAQST